MPESAAYSRRSFGKTAKPTSLSSPIDGGATTISLVDASTWPDGSGGPFMFTQDRGLSTEERIECPTRVGNLLQDCVRGADGTTPQSHGQTINGAEVTSTARDFDEANAHIANTALDHHLQYVRADGTRAVTGTLSVNRATAGVGLSIGKEAASIQAGSVAIGRSATTQPQSVVFTGGVAYTATIGRAGSSDNLEVGFFDGATYVRKGRWLPSGSVELNAGTSIATGATGGFVGLPYMGGTPSGVPDVSASIVYDTVANKLWVYSGGWRATAALA